MRGRRGGACGGTGGRRKVVELGMTRVKRVTVPRVGLRRGRRWLWGRVVVVVEEEVVERRGERL